MAKITNSAMCPWAQSSDAMQAYHDLEWGMPVVDDNKLFEFLLLEGAQAGLSWATILKRRENYRDLFVGFDFCQIAKFSPKKQAELLQNPAIIRNRRKISSAISNAQVACQIADEFGSLAHYFWQFVDFKPISEKWQDFAQIPAQTELSTKISKDLRQRGMNFIGPTIIYAFMQAVGMVNDHLLSCPSYNKCRDAGKKSITLQ